MLKRIFDFLRQLLTGEIRMDCPFCATAEACRVDDDDWFRCVTCRREGRAWDLPGFVMDPRA